MRFPVSYPSQTQCSAVAGAKQGRGDRVDADTRAPRTESALRSRLASLSIEPAGQLQQPLSLYSSMQCPAVHKMF